MKMMKVIGLILFAWILSACAAMPVRTETATATPAPEAPRSDAADQARFDLARILGVDPEKVQVVSIEQVDFPDGCLGIANPAMMCLAVITPGYRIILEAQGGQFEYRAPLDGSYVVPFSPLAGAPASPILTWRRVGGIAGFCDVLDVLPTGQAIAKTCDGAVIGAVTLSEEEFRQLLAWQQTYPTFRYGETDGAVADSMSIQVALYGNGSLEMTTEEKARMQQYAADLFARASGQVGLPPAGPTPEPPAGNDNPPISQAAAGIVSGRVCYPSEFIPPMTAYFLNVQDESYTELAIAENQSTYEVNLAPGKYLAFAYVYEYKLGGGYTEYVACGYAESCTNHNLKMFTVNSGAAVQGVDLCDWILEGLPLP